MYTLSKILTSRVLSFSSGLLLSFLWGWFAYRHLYNFIETKSWSLLLFSIIETIAVYFYISRSTPCTVSMNPFDWIIAFIGTFTPLSLRPEPYGIFPSGEYLVFLGALLQVLSILSLNRSFALVAAKPVIKTTLMYRVVRHPLYASYILGLAGYVLQYTSEVNITIYIISVVSIFIRVFREEHHLASDETYLEYMKIVKYRLIPFIF